MNALGKSLLLLFLSAFLVLPAPASIAGVKPLGFAPQKSSDQLIVYFHALGGEPHEPYLQPIRHAAIIDGIKHLYPGAGFLSLDYDPARIVAGDFASIDATIQAYINDFPNVTRIKLCGTSFGAYTALSYYSCAGDKVKSIVKGIVSMGVPDDLEILAKSSADKNVRQFLNAETVNSKQPGYLKSRSLSQIYKSGKIPSDTRIYIGLMKSDLVVPATCNKDLETNLKSRGFKVNLEKIDGGHGFPSLHFYEQGFRFTDQSEKPAKSLN